LQLNFLPLQQSEEMMIDDTFNEISVHSLRDLLSRPESQHMTPKNCQEYGA
jgi:hypothetical protein